MSKDFAYENRLRPSDRAVAIASDVRCQHVMREGEYWPLWKHMADHHGLTLLDSECEDIMQVVDQMLLKRLSGAVANIEKNIRLVDRKLKVTTESLRQIATSGKNSTRDRRNAKATLRFLQSLND